MFRAIPIVLVCVGLGFASGCDGGASGDGDAGVAIDATSVDAASNRAECESINPHHCLFPWPSNRFVIEDEATATGYRVSFPAAAMPQNRSGTGVDPSIYARFDGFPPSTPIMSAFAGELDTSALADEEHIDQSLSPDSLTVLLDAATGERVAHFAEVDEWPEADPELRTFFIRPARRLRENARYVVGIRGLRLTDGAAVEPSAELRALRDGDVQSARFERVFAELEAAGVPRTDLIEAWDFHTASGGAFVDDALAVRDDMLARLGERGLGCTVEAVDDSGGNLFRRIRGTFTVPLYLESDAPGALLHRDANGRPTANGTAEVPFEVAVPQSAQALARAGDPPVLVIFVHSVLGSEEGVSQSTTVGLLEPGGMVGGATRLWGMSIDDAPLLTSEVMTDWSNMPRVAERAVQGVNNYLALTRTLRGVCLEDDAFHVDGHPLFGSEVALLGMSQGGIYGGTIAALSPDIERAVLHVGAMSFPLILRRSIKFIPFELFLKSSYRDSLDRNLLLALGAFHWGLAEPAAFAPHLLADRFSGTPEKQVLLQVALADAEIANVASEYAARTMGLPVLRSSAVLPWGLEPVDAPVGSALVIHDIGGAPRPLGTNRPDEDNDVHGQLRREPQAIEQIRRFLVPWGRVEDVRR